MSGWSSCWRVWHCSSPCSSERSLSPAAGPAGEDILALIGSNTDFRAAFSDLGESLAEQDSVLGDIGEFCIQVFGSGQDSGGEASPALAGGVEEESRFLNSRPDMAELTAHYLRLDRVPDSWLPGSRRRERQPSRHRRPRRQCLRWERCC